MVPVEYFGLIRNIFTLTSTCPIAEIGVVMATVKKTIRFNALWIGPPATLSNLPERLAFCQVFFRRNMGGERVGRGVGGMKMSILKAIFAVFVISTILSILDLAACFRAAFSLFWDARRDDRAIGRRNKELKKQDRDGLTGW